MKSRTAQPANPPASPLRATYSRLRLSSCSRRRGVGACNVIGESFFVKTLWSVIARGSGSSSSRVGPRLSILDGCEDCNDIAAWPGPGIGIHWVFRACQKNARVVEGKVIGLPVT